MLKKLSGFNLGQFFAIKVAPEFPKKISKELSIDLAEKIVIVVVVVNFLPYIGNFMQSFFTLQVRFLEL